MLVITNVHRVCLLGCPRIGIDQQLTHRWTMSQGQIGEGNHATLGLMVRLRLLNTSNRVMRRVYEWNPIQTLGQKGVHSVQSGRPLDMTYVGSCVGEQTREGHGADCRLPCLAHALPRCPRSRVDDGDPLLTAAGGTTHPHLDTICAQTRGKAQRVSVEKGMVEKKNAHFSPAWPRRPASRRGLLEAQV